MRIGCLFLLIFGRGLVEGFNAATTTGHPKSNGSVVSGKRVVVVGAGPVGLYFAALMSQKDPNVTIELLDKRAAASTNAFGLGVGHRMQNRLKDVPGLYDQAISISAEVESLGIPLVSRDDLTQQMSNFVLDHFKNCRLTLGEECVSVDFDAKTLTTSSGRIVEYDLLLGADGVNSKIREQVVKEAGDSIKEQHYLEDARWKALKLPKQPDIEGGSFKPLQHPSIAGGRVLPKAPEGHILLLFWKDAHGGGDNPNGVDTIEDLKQMIVEAMQDKKSRFPNPLRKLMGLEQGDSVKKDRKVVFDEAALEEFISSRSGRAHHLQIDQYHYKDSVGLIGDSAHAFNSLLGQGCATGLESTHTLVESLMTSTTLENALSNYTEEARKEAHAMTELSLVNYAINGGVHWTSVRGLPLILWNMIRGKGLLKRIVDINVPYSAIAKENSRLLRMCRRRFEKLRKPLDYYSKR